jgi:hypothetical protein
LRHCFIIAVKLESQRDFKLHELTRHNPAASPLRQPLIPPVAAAEQSPLLLSSCVPQSNFF